MTVLIVPDAMAPDLRRYIAFNARSGRTYTTKPFVAQPDHSKSSLTFTIETFDDPETGEPTQYGRFSRNWQDEEALDVLIDQLEAGRVTHKQALMQALVLFTAAGSHHPGQSGNPELHCQPTVGAGFAG